MAVDSRQQINSRQVNIFYTFLRLILTYSYFQLINHAIVDPFPAERDCISWAYSSDNSISCLLCCWDEIWHLWHMSDSSLNPGVISWVNSPRSLWHICSWVRTRWIAGLTAHKTPTEKKSSARLRDCTDRRSLRQTETHSCMDLTCVSAQTHTGKHTRFPTTETICSAVS